MDWVAIIMGKDRYVSSEYVQVDFEIDYGETAEQVKAREGTARPQAEKEVAAWKQKKEKAKQAETRKRTRSARTGRGRQRAFEGAHSVKRRRVLRRTGSCRQS